MSNFLLVNLESWDKHAVNDLMSTKEGGKHSIIAILSNNENSNGNSKEIRYLKLKLNGDKDEINIQNIYNKNYWKFISTINYNTKYSFHL